jgi:HlyD family secretion protein
VRAPFAGEVAELFTEVGEFVGAGSPVARLLGSGPQLASFTVPPEDAQRIEALGRVTVVVAGLELPATVSRVERQAQQARLATVTATLDEGPLVPSGSVGEVRYDVVLGEGLIVPSGALTADGGLTYVFVVAGEGDATVARRVEVRVAAETGNQAVVAGVVPGTLVEGSAVVAPRPLDVRDGTRIRVVDVAGSP